MLATVERSCELLPPDAQALFERLSVFAGGFGLDAVEAVAPPSVDVLWALTTLVDHSLVVADLADVADVADGAVRRGKRFRVLEPVRQCAELRLTAAGAAEHVRRLHAEHHLDLVDRLDPSGLRGVASPLTLRQVAPDEANLVAALAWARTQPGDLALRLCTAMAAYWLADGRVADARTSLDDLLGGGTADVALQAAAREAAGSLAWRAGDYASADRRLDESLALARQLGDRERTVTALLSKARVAASAGDPVAVATTCREVIVISTDSGDATAEFWALVYLAWSHSTVGDHAQGDEQMRAANRVDHGVDGALATITVLFGLQYGAFLAGDPVAQRRHLLRVLAELDQGGFGVQEEADWLGACATLALGEGRPSTAIRLLGGAVQRLVRVGSHYPAGVVAPRLAHLDKAWQTMGPPVAGRLLDEGRSLSWSELVEQATAEPRHETSLLTPREDEVAVLVSRGLTNAEIATALYVSRRTVESHLDHIRRKLGFRSRHEITRWVLAGMPNPRPT